MARKKPKIKMITLQSLFDDYIVLYRRFQFSSNSVVNHYTMDQTLSILRQRISHSFRTIQDNAMHFRHVRYKDEGHDHEEQDLHI